MNTMAGKVVLITGATAGIGEETALQLAGMGARVVMHGRSPASCEAAVERIRQACGAQVEYLAADLASQAEVRALAQAFCQRYDRLDVLLNNAGTNRIRRTLTVDGIEQVIAVNHLAPFLLTHLLLDMLLASAPARIINVSSYYHRRAWFTLRWLQAGGLNAYPLSKLCNILFTYELARRLEGTGVTANALDPGLVRSNIHTKMAFPIGQLKRLLDLLGGVPVEEGARTSVYLASASELESVSGRYFARCRAEPSSRVSYDRRAARALWNLSERLVGLAPGTIPERSGA